MTETNVGQFIDSRVCIHINVDLFSCARIELVLAEPLSIFPDLGSITETIRFKIYGRCKRSLADER